MMIKFRTDMLTEEIKTVMLKVRVKGNSDIAGAKVGYFILPPYSVMTETGAECFQHLTGKRRDGMG